MRCVDVIALAIVVLQCPFVIWRTASSAEAIPSLDWSQPPIEIDPDIGASPVLCGWDEPARSTETSGSRRQWRMDADDFRCLGPIPITRIRWWGGYKGWRSPEPPELQPTAWHIGFWANQVAGLDPNELYLERLVWSIEVRDEQVSREPVGMGELPGDFWEMCYVCDLRLEPDEWFNQAEFGSNADVFWISITAIYPPDAKPINLWGWMTRPIVWGGGAVMPAIMGDWPTDEERLFPGRICPIESSALCGESQPYDLCFELLTGEPWAEWDQPFTGIRNWPHYDGHASFAIEDPNGTLQVDRQVTDDWAGECSQVPITAVSWAGSYQGYGWEFYDCSRPAEPRRPDYFQLSIRANVPAGQEGPLDRPGELLWQVDVSEYDKVFVGYDRQPSGEPNEPVFRYSVRLPENMWFQHEGNGTTYWFSVMAVYQEAHGEVIDHPWGWTSHEYAFGNAASSLSETGGGIDRKSLSDPMGAPIDMSFTLFASPEP